MSVGVGVSVGMGVGLGAGVAVGLGVATDGATAVGVAIGVGAATGVSVVAGGEVGAAVVAVGAGVVVGVTGTAVCACPAGCDAPPDDAILQSLTTISRMPSSVTRPSTLTVCPCCRDKTVDSSALSTLHTTSTVKLSVSSLTSYLLPASLTESIVPVIRAKLSTYFLSHATSFSSFSVCSASADTLMGVGAGVGVRAEALPEPPLDGDDSPPQASIVKDRRIKRQREVNAVDTRNSFAGIRPEPPPQPLYEPSRGHKCPCPVLEQVDR